MESLDVLVGKDFVFERHVSLAGGTLNEKVADICVAIKSCAVRHDGFVWGLSHTL